MKMRRITINKLTYNNSTRGLPWKEYPVKQGVMFNVDTAIDAATNLEADTATPNTK